MGPPRQVKRRSKKLCHLFNNWLMFPQLLQYPSKHNDSMFLITRSDVKAMILEASNFVSFSVKRSEIPRKQNHMDAKQMCLKLGKLSLGRVS